MCLKNIIILGCIALFASCSSGAQKPKAEASWQRKAKYQAFLEVSVKESLDSSRQILDTLLSFYAKDSIVMHEMDAYLTPPLSDPTSQIRKEELYVPLLEAIISSPFYDSIAKIQRQRAEISRQRSLEFYAFLKLSVREPLDSSRQILDALLSFYAADSLAMREIDAFFTPALSDPNSQIRNEELYIPLLEAIIASSFYDSTEKIRPRFQLSMAMKNRVGFAASDFAYTLVNGRQGNMYGVKTPFTIVYINNPDCPMCEDIRDLMVASELIADMLKTNKLTILAIYPDEDITAWRNNLKTIPKEWLNGYDAELDFRKKELYDIRAIPSLYLLDNDKKVLLKDCVSVPLIEAYLTQPNRY